MIKNLQKNKSNPAVIDVIDQKMKAEIELSSLNFSYELTHNNHDRLKNKESQLRAEIYPLKDSPNDEHKRICGQKQQELTKVLSDLNAVQSKLSTLKERVAALENEINEPIAVSVADIVAHQSLITAEMSKAEILGKLLDGHNADIEKCNRHSNTAAPLIAQRNNLLIDAELGASNSTELEQLNAKITQAVDDDAAINAENKKVLAEKTGHIEALNARISTTTDAIASLKTRHKKLLGEFLKTMLIVESDVYQKAVNELKATLKTTTALVRINDEIGVSANSNLFTKDGLISGLINTGLIAGFDEISGEITTETSELKSRLSEQGIDLAIAQ